MAEDMFEQEIRDDLVLKKQHKVDVVDRSAAQEAVAKAKATREKEATAPTTRHPSHVEWPH